MEGGTAGDNAQEEKQFEDFRAEVKRRIEKYEASKGQDEDSEFNTTEEISTGALFLRQADGCDKCYMYTAFIASTVFGAGMPGFCFFFGGMIDGVANPANLAVSFKTNAYMMTGLGVIMGGFSWA